MSLCRTPTEWAAATASATCAPSSRRSASGTAASPPCGFGPARQAAAGGVFELEEKGACSNCQSKMRAMSSRLPRASRKMPSSVTSRFRARSRPASQQNLKTRRSPEAWRASQTSPKPPSPIRSTRVHEGRKGICCSLAGRQPSIFSSFGDSTRRAREESSGRGERRAAFEADLEDLDRILVALEEVGAVGEPAQLARRRGRLEVRGAGGSLALRGRDRRRPG